MILRFNQIAIDLSRRSSCSTYYFRNHPSESGPVFGRIENGRPILADRRCLPSALQLIAPNHEQRRATAYVLHENRISPVSLQCINCAMKHLFRTEVTHVCSQTDKQPRLRHIMRRALCGLRTKKRGRIIPSDSVTAARFSGLMGLFAWRRTQQRRDPDGLFNFPQCTGVIRLHFARRKAKLAAPDLGAVALVSCFPVRKRLNTRYSTRHLQKRIISQKSSTQEPLNRSHCPEIRGRFASWRDSLTALSTIERKRVNNSVRFIASASTGSKRRHGCTSKRTGYWG